MSARVPDVRECRIAEGYSDRADITGTRHKITKQGKSTSRESAAIATRHFARSEAERSSRGAIGSGRRKEEKNKHPHKVPTSSLVVVFLLLFVVLYAAKAGISEVFDRGATQAAEGFSAEARKGGEGAKCHKPEPMIDSVCFGIGFVSVVLRRSVCIVIGRFVISTAVILNGGHIYKARRVFSTRIYVKKEAARYRSFF